MREKTIMKSISVSMLALASLMGAGSVLATDMPAAAKRNGCTTCHAIDRKVVGPSWMDVSAFYNGKMGKSPAGLTVNEATGGKNPKEFLIKKVSKGGHGNWGTAPMIANDDVFHQPSEVKQGEIKELVEFILGLAKKDQ
jgi:cytochrome c